MSNNPLFIEIDAGDRLNLYDGTLQVIEGWFPQTAGDDPNAPIWETIPLIAEGTQAEINTALVSLRDMLRKARDYQIDMLVNEPVYLGMEDANFREAHSTILKGSLKPIYKVGTSPYMDTINSQVKTYVLRLLRIPYWEEEIYSQQSVVDISAWGGTEDFNNNIGTRDGRVYESYASGIALGKMWLGWRKERGGLTNWVPRVEIEDGWLASGELDTALFRDADASPSDIPDNCIEIDFANVATMRERWHIDIQDHVTAVGAGAANLYKGRYLVIAKWKGGDSTTKFGVQLKHGYFNSRDLAANQEVLFSNDGWRSTPMGLVTLPPNPTHRPSGIVDDNLGKYRFQFWAERITGSANLYLDGFVLMPTDHLITVTRNPNLTGGLWKYFFFTRSDGRPVITGATLVGEIPDQNAEASFHNFRMPLDDSKLVYVREVGAEDATANQTMIATDDLLFRWKGTWDDFYAARS